jgi:2-dehydro-3-deoxy-D-arabinonate dehydratase
VPELVLVINCYGEIVGYCAGNDVSSRDIEGENPLYLPQAKVYNGSCALGHGIVLCEPGEIKDLSIRLKIEWKPKSNNRFTGAIDEQ